MGRRTITILGVGALAVLIGGTVAARGFAPWCDLRAHGDLPPVPAMPSLGVVSTGGRSTRDDASVGAVVRRYVDGHADEAAGTWIDPDHGDALVVAFTGHLDEHRAAVAALRPTPADLLPVTIVPTTVLGGASGSATTPGSTTEVPPDWPTQPVYVVAQPRTEGELRGIQAELTGAVFAGEPVNAAGVDVVRNRAMVGFAHVSPGVRWAVARRYGADRVCVEEGVATAAGG